MNLTACFHDNQFIDAGNGNFGLQLTMPAPVSYGNSNGGVLVAAGQSLPLYDAGEGSTAPAPAGTYWLIVRPSGQASVLAVAERKVTDLGIYGFFRKQNGVAFVSPRSENDCAFGFVYMAK